LADVPRSAIALLFLAARQHEQWHFSNGSFFVPAIACTGAMAVFCHVRVSDFLFDAGEPKVLKAQLWLHCWGRRLRERVASCSV